MKTRFMDINLLRELERPDFEGLRRDFSPLSFERGSVMFRPRSEQNLVFVVRTGKVRVYLSGEDRDFTLAILEPGDVYATHTSAWVQALEPVTVLVMDTESFYRHMTEHTALAKTVIYVLGGILKQSFAIIDSLAFKDIRRRLVEFILYEVERCGPSPDGGARVSLGMTTEQVAAIVGATRQTVSTLVNEMVREGVLVKEGRGVFLVPEVTRLRDYS
jgi:CRP-like cAMP-binding protein